MVLLKAGVNVAIGVTDESTARNTRFDIAWVSLVPFALPDPSSDFA